MNITHSLTPAALYLGCGLVIPFAPDPVRILACLVIVATTAWVVLGSRTKKPTP